MSIQPAPKPVLINPNMESVPLPLRANDIKVHIVNVDSRFRQRPVPTASDRDNSYVATEKSSASDFYFFLNPPIKNVLRIRVTSIEFPNNYLFFTALRHNTTLRFLWTVGGVGQSQVITIPDGNYSADDMVAALTLAFADVDQGNLKASLNLSVKFFPETGKFVFAANTMIGLDTSYDAYPRPFDYGLAYYMGFTRKLQLALKPCVGVSNCFEIISDMCANFSGDSYLFLQVNDYNCVRHNTGDNTLGALAKIVLREPKNFMVYDDYAGQHAKEVVFPAPENLSRLHIRVVDAYGVPVDLCAMNFSFSLEVMEVRNSSLYSTLQGSQSSHYF